MSRDVADDLILRGDVQGEVFETARSGHHLYVEAAHEVCSGIIKFVNGFQAQADFLQAN